MSTLVTDPALLAQLNAGSSSKVSDPATLAKLDYDVDVTGPEDQVRSSIAALPAEKQQGALKHWADHYVSKERAASTLPNIPQPAASLPFFKEAASAANAGIHMASGGKLGRPYSEGLALERARAEAQHKATPITSTVTDLAAGFALPIPGGAAASAPGRVAQGAGYGAGYGALYGASEGNGLADRFESAMRGAAVGAPLGGAAASAAELVRGVQQARAGIGRTGAYNRFASQLPDENVNTFANQVATGAVGHGPANQNVQRRTLDIVGEEMERAGGNRGQAEASAVARIQREFGVTANTARENLRALNAAQRNSTLLLAEYPAAAESNAAIRSHTNPAKVTPEEAGMIRDSSAHRLIDDLANGPGSQSAPAVRNAVGDRNLGGRDSMRETLGQLAPRAPGGNGPRTIEDLAQMQDGAQRAASAEYRAAYAPGNTNDRLLVGLLPRVLDRHANRMAGRSGVQAQALQQALNEFRITTPQGQTLNMMTLQQLQDARGAVRAQIQAARGMANGSGKPIVSTLQPLYNDVTRLMERSNPQWARANRRWADDSIDTRARELGEAFSNKAGPEFRRQLGQYRQLAPEAQDMVKVEWLQKQADKLDNLGDTHDVAKLFTNDHMRNATRELFGDQGVVTLAQMVRDLGIASRSGQMLKGSQTAMRLARREDGNIETGILAAAEMTSVDKIKSALLKRFASLLTENRNRPLAQIATTPMSDMPEVARHIHNMRTAQQYRERLAQPVRGGQVAGPAGSSAGEIEAERRANITRR